MLTPNLTYQTHKVPSYLKGLVVRRARFDGHSLRLSAVIAELQTELARAVADRDACDVLLREWNDSIDLAHIAPVSAWKDRYGKLGLRNTVIRQLEGAGSAGLTTEAVTAHLAAQFNIKFLAKAQREDWASNSVKPILRRLVQRGMVERVDASDVGRSHKVWRRVQPVEGDFDSLVQQAEATGLAIKSGSKAGARPK